MAVLYIAGISISENLKDIPGKTIKTISNCDIIIGEERKVALNMQNIAKSTAEILLVNEHSTDEERFYIYEKIKKVEKAVLFSDAGTPCISDPDYKLIAICRDNGIKIISLPGPSSITTAISVSGINAKTFYFAGFPPRKESERKIFFEKLEKNNETVVFMERPYALSATLKDMARLQKKVSISLNLGCEDEETYYDFPKKLLDKLNGKKAPFVVVVEGVKGNKKNINSNKNISK